MLLSASCPSCLNKVRFSRNVNREENKSKATDRTIA